MRSYFYLLSVNFVPHTRHFEIPICSLILFPISGELESSHALKFPGPTSSPRHRFVPEIPKECQEMGICEKVPNYPQEHVDQILATVIFYKNINVLLSIDKFIVIKGVYLHPFKLVYQS